MVMLLYGPHQEPRGLTSIPGFKSEAECDVRAAGLINQPIFKEPSLLHLYTWCTEGPLK
jgi:hypothetical protein